MPAARCQSVLGARHPGRPGPHRGVPGSRAGVGSFAAVTELP